MSPCIIVVTLAIVLFILVLEYTTLPFFFFFFYQNSCHITLIHTFLSLAAFVLLKNAFADTISPHLRKKK